MKKNLESWLVVGCVAVALCLASAAMAQTPSSPTKGDTMTSTVEVTATVTKIDHKTREVTIKTPAGDEYTFVAGAEVKNLDQVNQGDTITATYAEELAYEVKKGGQTAGPESSMVAAVAKPGAKPAAGVAKNTTATVLVTAIDHKAPSVTFKGPKGNTRTIKVRDASRLEGVNVGDTVQLSYTEAVALKVEKKEKK